MLETQSPLNPGNKGTTSAVLTDPNDQLYPGGNGVTLPRTSTRNDLEGAFGTREWLLLRLWEERGGGTTALWEKDGPVGFGADVFGRPRDGAISPEKENKTSRKAVSNPTQAGSGTGAFSPTRRDTQGHCARPSCIQVELPLLSSDPRRHLSPPSLSRLP